MLTTRRRRGEVSPGNSDLTAVFGTKLGFEQLAGRGMRQRFHEDHIIRHPEFGAARRQESLERFLGWMGSRLGMHQQQSPFLPLRMREGDDGRLEPVGMRD